MPVFEKPVIIRPKSTSDFRRLQRGFEDGERKRDSPIQLRVEQDLEGKISHTELQDDKDFEIWFESMQDDLEAACVDKYRLPPFMPS